MIDFTKQRIADSANMVMVIKEINVQNGGKDKKYRVLSYQLDKIPLTLPVLLFL